MKKRLSRLGPIAAFFAVAVFFATILFVRTSPATALGEVIIGTVTYPNGSPAIGVQMELHLPDGTISYHTPTDASGNYSFTQSLIAGDNWSLELQPPTGYNKPANCPYTFVYQTSDSMRTVNFQLINAQKTIHGIVTQKDGTPVTDADVDAYPAVQVPGVSKVSAHTDAQGAYSFSVQGGTWYVNAVANLSDQNIRWITETHPLPVTFLSDESSESATENFTVTQATGNLQATLLNSDGAKLTSSNFVADIDVRRVDGIGTVRKVASADSSLNIYLTPGIYHICAFHSDLAGKSFDPEQTTFAMADDGTVTLGTVTATVDSAHLKGKVTDKNGKGIGNISLMAFSGNGCNRPTANTDQNGNFDITVGAGNWTVGLNVTGGNAPAYNQATPAMATLKNGETASGLAISMKPIDRTIHGRVLSSGTVVTGFVGSAYIRTTNNTLHVSAPVVDGAFHIAYSSSDISDKTVLLGILADPGAGYSSATETKVTVNGASTTKDITVKEFNATIHGSLLLPDKTAVTDAGSTINVYAVDQDGNFVSTTAGNDGSYSLAVSAGTWFVNYDIVDPAETANLLDRPVGEDTVTVASGKAATKNLTIFRGTNTITGIVTDVRGVAVPSAQVVIDNRPALENNSNTNPNAIITTTVETDALGVYHAKVPNGSYMVSIGDTPEVDATQLQPDGKTITVSGTTSKIANFVFKKTDATIAGTVKLNKKTEGGGTVTAWSKDGSQTTATVGKNGKYSLPVNSGETWTVNVTDLTGKTLAASDATEIKVKKGTNKKDLALQDTGTKVYGPVTKSFDAADPQSISLPDGVTVSVPGHALDLSGTVSLTVTPVINSDPTTGDVSASLAYEVKATDADGYELKDLNAPATITLPYRDSSLGDKGLREKTLGTKYFNPETKVWEAAPGFVDTKDNIAKLSTVHLTTFSITGTAKSAPKVTSVAKKSLTTSTLVLEIKGQYFSGTPIVKLGTLKAKKVQAKSSSLLLATFNLTGLKAGQLDLTVMNGNGRSTTKAKFVTLVKKGSTLLTQGL